MLDTVVRGEPAPSKRTLGCLLMIAVGAASYARDDANFTVRGYSWACVYLAIIVTEMVYAKHVTATINLSTWSLVLYQNAIALFLWPFASFFSGEFRSLSLLYSGRASELPEGFTHEMPALSAYTLVPLLTSCLLAIGISFSAWGTRSVISATQFTVLGVACKLATVAPRGRATDEPCFDVTSHLGRSHKSQITCVCHARHSSTLLERALDER